MLIGYVLYPQFTPTARPSLRAKNCKKGIACGNSCISKGKTCKKTLTPAVQQLVPPAKAKTKKAPASKKSPSATTTAPPPPATKPSLVGDLRSAIDSGDYAKVIDVAAQLYDQAKKRAPNAKTFNQGTKAGNGTVEDFILKELWSDSGYDAKPSVVTSADFDKTAVKGTTVMYRATSSTQQKFQQRFSDFKNGDYFAGHGIYGHGTYVANADAADAKTRELILAEFRSAAVKAAKGYGVDVMRMQLDPSSKVVMQTDLDIEATSTKMAMMRHAYSNGYKPVISNNSYAQKVEKAEKLLFGDIDYPNYGGGRFATIKGYDAVKLDMSYDPTYMLLLNRGKVTIDETSLGKRRK